MSSTTSGATKCIIGSGEQAPKAATQVLVCVLWDASNTRCWPTERRDQGSGIACRKQWQAGLAMVDVLEPFAATGLFVTYAVL